MVKRIALALVVLTVAVALIGSLALSIFLSSWVPVKGKARIIQELERRWPVTVSLGSVRYDLFQGLILEEVRVVERPTQELWCAIPSMQIHVGRLALLLRRHVSFRSRVLLEAPCQTFLALSGRYRLRDGSLSLDVESTDIPLQSITGVLRRVVPPSLADGIVRLDLQMRESSPRRPVITGRLAGAGVTWASPPWRAVGDLHVVGAAAPPTPRNTRWSLNALATLSRATVEGAPIGGAIARVAGTARITQDQIDIEQVTGTALEAPWTMEGTIAFRPLSLEVLVTSHTSLSPLAAAFPAVGQAWQPEGAADLRIGCRGPLRPAPWFDCLAHAEVRGAALAGSKLIVPFTDITGGADYDVPARRLAIGQLRGRFAGAPVTVSGVVDASGATELALKVSGTLPLSAAAPWLPDANAVSDLGGTAAVTLDVLGRPASPRFLGSVQLRDAAARFMKPAIRVEKLTGTLTLADDRIDIADSSLRLNDQPLTLAATIVPGEAPRLNAAVGFANGELTLIGRLSPQELLIDDGRVALERSRLSFHGAVARAPDRPSALSFAGAVELAELNSVPFVRLPPLSDWKLAGLIDTDTQLEGVWSDWPSMTIRSRNRATHVSARQIPLDQLVCTVEQRQGVLRVRIPSGLLASGRLSGELVVEHHPATRRYLLQADAIGVRLEELAQAIPAWRTRSVTGSASASALVSGTWEERATWRGEGWINGSGQRLADVPLLDKVLRGLFGVLGDRLGLDMLRRAEITQAAARWTLAQERVSTDDLRLGGLAGTEPIALYAKGGVGLDQTLDFVIEPELSEGVVLQSPATSSLAATVLKAAGQLERLRRLIGRHRITGTLNDPVYRFEFSTQEIFKQLAPGPGDLIQQLLDAVRKPAS